MADPSQSEATTRSRRRVGDDPAEIRALEEQILERLKEADDQHRRDEEFVRYRFGNQLRNFWSWNGWYAVAFIVVTAASLITSLASSSIAAGWGTDSWARWLILILGLIGAVAALVNWSWKPGQKAISRTRGANALRAEGWAFVHRRGRYVAIPDTREAFGLFVDEVGNITRVAASVDESGPEGPAPGSES